MSLCIQKPESPEIRIIAGTEPPRARVAWAQRLTSALRSDSGPTATEPTHKLGTLSATT